MAETKKRKRAKRLKTKGVKKVTEEAAEVTRPGAEEAAPEERSPLKQTILAQYMKDPSFRRRVIYHLIKKLR